MQLLEGLTQEYSEFFDIPSEILSAGVEVSYSGWIVGRTHIPSKTIRLPLYNRIGLFRKMVLRHEYRHIIHRNIIDYVVRENPILYASYLNDTVDFQKLEKKTRNPDLKEIIQRFSEIDSEEFQEKYADELSLFSGLFNFSKRPDLFESFAANNRTTEIAYTMAISLAGLQTAQFFYDMIDNLGTYTEATTKLFLNAAVAIIFLSNTRYVIKDNETFTVNHLSKFPTEQRKYLVAIPPNRGVRFSEHLTQLKEYGFSI